MKSRLTGRAALLDEAHQLGNFIYNHFKMCDGDCQPSIQRRLDALFEKDKKLRAKETVVKA